MQSIFRRALVLVLLFAITVPINLLPGIKPAKALINFLPDCLDSFEDEYVIIEQNGGELRIPVSQATQVQERVYSRNSGINTAGENDYYIFTAADTGAYTLQTRSNIATEANLYECEDNIGYRWIASDDLGRGVSENSRIVFGLSQGKKYLVKINNPNNRRGRYSFLLTPPSGTIDIPSSPHGRLGGIRENIDIDIPDINVYDGWARATTIAMVSDTNYYFASPYYLSNNGVHHLGTDIDYRTRIGHPIYAIADGEVYYRLGDCAHIGDENISRVYIKHREGSIFNEENPAGNNEFWAVYAHTWPADFDFLDCSNGGDGDDTDNVVELTNRYDIRAGDIVGYTTIYGTPHHLHLELSDHEIEGHGLLTSGQINNAGHPEDAWGATGNPDHYGGKLDAMRYLKTHFGSVEPLVFNAPATMNALVQAGIIDYTRAPNFLQSQVDNSDARFLVDNNNFEAAPYPDMNITRIEAVDIIIRAIEDTANIDLRTHGVDISQIFSDMLHVRAFNDDEASRLGGRDIVNERYAAREANVSQALQNSLSKAYEIGIVDLPLDNLFHPYRLINRQEFLEMIMLAVNQGDQNYTYNDRNIFNDLPPNDAENSNYRRAIVAASDSGVTTEANSFAWAKIHPRNPVPRHRAAMWVSEMMTSLPDYSSFEASDEDNQDQDPELGANQPPSAAIAITNLNLLDVTADASASRDPDGHIVSYSWDFGDASAGLLASLASFRLQQVTSSSLNQNTISHLYSEPGDYTVSLTVTDNDGAEATVTQEITVYADPVALNIEPKSATTHVPTVFRVYLRDDSSLTDFSIQDCDNQRPIGNGPGWKEYECTPNSSGYKRALVRDLSLPESDRLDDYSLQILVNDLPADQFGDDFTNPSPLAFDNPTSGTIEAPGARDYFIFTPPSSGVYHFDISGMPAAIKLYSGDSVNGYTKIADDHNVNGFFIRNLNAGEPYIFTVRHVSNAAGSYTVNVTQPANPDDPFFASPRVLDFRTNTLNPFAMDAVGGTYFINSTGDSSMFKFTPNHNSEYEIEVKSIDNRGFTVAADYSVVLYNSNRVQLQAGHLVNGEFSFTSPLNSNQDYFVKVTRHSGVNTYLLSVLEHVPEPHPNSPDDHGNTISSATEIVSITRNVRTAVGGQINYRRDEDWFKFTLNRSGRMVDIYTENAPFAYGPPYNLAGSNDTRRHTSNLRGSLYRDGDFDNPVRSANYRYDRYGYNQLGSNFSLGRYFNLAAGTYYLKVDHSSPKGQGISYNLVFETEINNFDDHGDTQQTATYLTLGQQEAGTLEDNIDYEYFAYTPQRTGHYTVSISADFDIAAQIADEFIDTLRDLAYSYNRRNVSTEVGMIAGQTYYIRIGTADLSQIGDYTVTIAEAIGGHRFDSVGDDTSTAVISSRGSSHESGIEVAGDVDFYEITADRAGFYYPEATNRYNTSAGGIDFAYEIYKEAADGTIALEGSPVRVYLNQGEKIFVKVFDQAASTGRYEFIMHYDDYAGVDNTLAQLVLDQAQAGRIERVNDQDVLSFTVPDDARYLIEITGVVSALFRPEGHIHKFYDRYDNGARATEAELEQGQTYYLEVSSGTVGDYSITLKRNPDDHGNFYTTSTDIVIGQDEVIGEREAWDLGHDRDVFKLQVDQNNLISFENILGSFAEVEVHLEIAPPTSPNLQPSTQLLRTFNVSSSSHHMYLIAGNTYYLHIKVNDTSAGRGYHLPLNVFVPVQDDVGNDSSGAPLLSIDQVISGQIDYEEDRDWYKFTSDTANSADEIHTIELSGSDINLKIYNSNGALIDSLSTVAASNDEASLDIALATGDYFFELIHDSVLGTGSYQFKVIGPDDYVDSEAVSHIGGMQIPLANGRLERVGDIDFMRFAIPQTDVYILESHGNLNLNGAIYRETNNTNGSLNRRFLYHRTDGAQGDNFKIQELFDPGNYLLRVSSGEQDITGDYQISFERYVPPPDQESDTKADASDVDFYHLYTGTRDHAGDEDYFGFDVANYGYYTVESDLVTRSFQVHCGNSFYNSYNYGGVQKVYNRRFYPGKCYVKFGDSYTADQYSYSFRIIPPDEPDSIYAYDIININAEQAQIGYIESANDVDAFQFTVPSTGYYEVETTGDIDTKIKVYDNSRIQIAEVDSGGQGDNAKYTGIMFANHQMRFEVSVPPGASPQGLYEIKVRRIAPRDFAAVQQIARDTLETISFDGDGKTQVLEFTTAHDGTYDFNVDGLNGFETMAELKNLNGAFIYSRNGRFVSSHQFSGILEANTSYRIYLTPKDPFQVGSCDVQITTPAPDDVGDSFADALQVPGSDPSYSFDGVIGGSPDEEYFWFVPAQSGQYTIEVTGVQVNGVYLYDSSQAYKGYGTYSNVGGHKHTLNYAYFQAGQRYYIRVFGYTRGDYHLSINHSQPADDYGNSIAQANYSDGHGSGSLENTGDIDVQMYYFNYPYGYNTPSWMKTKTFTVSPSGANPLQSYRAKVYFGNTLYYDSGNLYGGSFTRTLYFAPQGMYYIEVSSPSNQTGTYSVNIN